MRKSLPGVTALLLCIRASFIGCGKTTPVEVVPAPDFRCCRCCGKTCPVEVVPAPGLSEAAEKPVRLKLCQPRTFSPGERVFKPAGTLTIHKIWALALVVITHPKQKPALRSHVRSMPPRRFVSGPGFSRAVEGSKDKGFSP